MQDQPFFPLFLQSYFIALGVLLGGAIVGGMAAFLTGKPPLTEIYRLSNMIKIWAIVTAIGGTFDTVYTFERLFGRSNQGFVQTFLVNSFCTWRSPNRGINY